MKLSQFSKGIPESELVVSARRGDRSAFRALYERYRDRVHNLACYLLTDSLAAEDTLQNVFIKAFRALPEFRGDAGFGSWLYRITVNECLNQNRRQTQNYVPLEAILGSGQELDEALRPDEEHSRRECQYIIRDAVMELPDHLRAAVVLRYIEGLDYKEIAAILDCSTGTVASRLSRALQALEERLAPLRKLL